MTMQQGQLPVTSFQVVSLKDLHGGLPVRHSIVNFKPVSGKLQGSAGQLHYMHRPLAPVGVRRATSMTPSGGLFSIS